jgi:MFS family permease
MNKTFRSLRNRNFRLYFFGQLISNTGNWLTTVALILFVLKVTGSGFAVGILSALSYGPIFFLSPWAGAIADRRDKRKLLFLTQALEMIQSASLAVLAFMPHPPIIGLYALALFGGILLAFDNPFRRSFVGEMVPREDLPNAVVLFSSVVNFSRIFGPALAGLLTVTLGFGWCFTIDALSYLVVLICIIMMRTKELHRPIKNYEDKSGIKEGIRYIASMPVLWITFVILAAIGTLAYNFNVTLPLFVTKGLHSTGGVFTILYSIFSLGALLGGLAIAHRNLVGIKHVILGAFFLGLSMLMLAFMPNVLLAFPIAFLVGAASVLYTTSTTAIVQLESKHHMHGRILALQSVFIMGTAVIGGPLSGWISDVLGGRAPIFFGGIVCLAAAIFGYFSKKYYIPPSKIESVKNN